MIRVEYIRTRDKDLKQLFDDILEMAGRLLCLNNCFLAMLSLHLVNLSWGFTSINPTSICTK